MSWQTRAIAIYLGQAANPGASDDRHPSARWRPARWKPSTDLARQLGCSVVVPIYGPAPSHHAADAVTPVAMNTCASTRNAPTGVGKLGLPGGLSGGVTPSPGG
jgi:hypothetical protein